MKISIITPSLNQCAYLRQTMESILSQQGEFELQWVVVDGGSTDGTLELLHGLNDSRVSWSSEPDGGQSAAVNKGLAKVDGEIVGWLNSDDLYLPGALDEVVRVFAGRPTAQWVVGRCGIMDSQGKEIREGVTRYKNRSLRKYSYRKLLRENMISQPAVFWRKELIGKVGALDQSLHYTMDYDLWLRMGRISEPVLLERELARFRIHARSKSGEVNREHFDEQFRVATRYFNGDWRSRWAHRLNVEKIVWAYRLMRIAGW
ncbi:MAG: glycosyltransferase [Phycisphaerales bacterium]|nr:glycosyltransferase [Phycisphaerales bacterium]